MGTLFCLAGEEYLSIFKNDNSEEAFKSARQLLLALDIKFNDYNQCSDDDLIQIPEKYAYKFIKEISIGYVLKII